MNKSVTLNAAALVLSDWTKLYNKEVILNADCTFFPEFKNVKCVIKNVQRSKSNAGLFIISVIIKRRNKAPKAMQVDSGMAGLTVTVVK